MLTKWDTLFLLFMTIPIMGHVIILPILYDVAGRDAWISILLSIPIAFLIGFVIFRLRLKYPNQDFLSMLQMILGKKIGSILSTVFIGYFLFLTIFTFASYVDFVHIAFLPETPQLAMALWFLLFLILAAIKGIKNIALAAGVLTFISGITGHTVTMLDTPMKDWNHLKPFVEFGWGPILLGMLVIVSIWIELLLLLCVPLKNIREKHLFLVWGIGIILNGVMMLSTTTGSITIFGVAQSQVFLYPALESVRIISLGFIDRFDVYGLLLMTEGVFIRCSLYFRLSYDITVSKISSKWAKRGWFTGFIVLVCVLSYFLSKEQFRLDQTIHAYIYTLFMIPIPFILLTISRLRTKKNQNGV